MKVKDLKEFLNNFDDEQEVFAEDKITGNEFPFVIVGYFNINIHIFFPLTLQR